MPTLTVSRRENGVLVSRQTRTSRTPGEALALLRIYEQEFSAEFFGGYRKREESDGTTRRVILEVAAPAGPQEFRIKSVLTLEYP